MALRATEQIALPRNGRKAVRDESAGGARVPFRTARCSNPATLERDLGPAFGTLGDLRERNPFGNSVKLLALELGKRLDAGKLELWRHRAADPASVGGSLRAIAPSASPPISASATRRRTRRRSAPPCAGSRCPTRPRASKPTPRPFAEFQALLERELFGIVITAHPTFSQSTEMLRYLAELAMERDAAGNKLTAQGTRSAACPRRARVEHRPPAQIDLAYEHKLSIEAIGNIQRALAPGL